MTPAPLRSVTARLGAAALLLALAGEAAADPGLDRMLGRALFERAWVSAPSSTAASDGLGPLYNARACAGCHPGGGRGGGPEGRPRGLVLMLAATADGTPHPTYGRQLQERGIGGQPGEAALRVGFEEHRFRYPDGAEALLRRPLPEVAAWAYGSGHPAALQALRLAPPLMGLGLLERADPAFLAAAADPGDRDDDGVSGRLALVIDPRTGTSEIGRFGWKAAMPSLARQNARALAQDLGLSSALEPASWGDCTAQQQACRAAPHGAPAGTVEIGEVPAGLLLAYTADALRPPGAPPADLPGAGLFAALGCGACHQPALPLTDGGHAAAYTDLLLHDLGPGLAAPMAEAGAEAGEWRTAPLWGLGAALRAPTPALLHDGRARDAAEAILWHGGEAAAARDAFARLTAAQRADLVDFLESL